MLKDWNKMELPSDEEIENRLKAARDKLVKQQIMMKEKKLPVIVLFEGWGAAGKGSVLGKVIKNIDPRFFKVAVMDEPTDEEKRKPFLYRHFIKIPEAGKFVFMDSGWMSEVTRQKLRAELSDEQYNKRVESIKRFERQLTDNGYLLLKFFFDIDKKEQKKRLNKLKEDKNTKWRVSEHDKWQNKHYDECQIVYDQYLCDTNHSSAPWYLVNAKDKKWAQLQVLETIVQGIDTAFANSALSVPLLQNAFPLKPIHKLSEVNLDKSLSDEEYERLLGMYQKKLGELHGRVMVERLEGFCSVNDWQRAYVEINEFEKELSDWGAVIIKFWVQIDKDTQLERFKDRENTPEKRWKITEEDWRNREKWDSYEEAVNEMLLKTNTAYAPWHILESNDKKYARIKALKTVIEALEARL